MAIHTYVLFYSVLGILLREENQSVNNFVSLK